MKNNKLRLVLMLLVAFCVSTMSAQDKATQIKKEAPKSNKEIEKVKDQKSDFDEKLDKKGGSFTEAASTAKGKPGQVDKDAVKDKAKSIEQIEASYSKRIDAAKDSKEQARLKEEMNEKIMELKKSGDDAVTNNTSGGSLTESSSGKVKPKEDNKEDAQVNKGKPTVAIKNEKISSTKANISNRRKSLDNRKRMIDNANAKVAAAKAKLDAAKDEGNLSEEEIAAKEAKISSAEAKIAKLEASINKAEKKFDENDAKLSDFGKDKDN